MRHTYHKDEVDGFSFSSKHNTALKIAPNTVSSVISNTLSSVVFNVALGVMFSLVLSVVLSIALTSHVSAYESTSTTATKNASVTVSAACSFTAGGGAYSETVYGGSNTVITANNIVTSCNDLNGYAVYAIGYSGDSYDSDTHTDLITSLGNSYNIKTAGNTYGSSWQMKITPGINATIENDFDIYQNIPATFTKVAQYTANTNNGTITPSYQINVAGSQPAGTYIGKVKYVLVHPYDSAAPLPAPSPTCNTPVPGITYMQDINSTNKASVLASLTQDSPYYLYDNRDNTPYCVGKLADGNLWMLDNLALDLTDSTVLNGMNSANTHASDTTLGYLKNGGGTTSDQYAITGVVNWIDSEDYASSYSYSDPLADLDSKDVVPADAISTAGGYKIGGYYNYCAASAGSYCYGNGTDYGTSSGNATEDICPAGWRMPTGGSSGEYSALANAIYGSTSSTSDATAYANYRSALHLPLSGYFRSGLASTLGSYGYWWSSTRNYINTMCSLGANTSTIYPARSDIRLNGSSLRCVAGS